MSNIWHDINPERIKPEDFISVIEISKYSAIIESIKNYGFIRNEVLLWLDLIS